MKAYIIQVNYNTVSLLYIVSLLISQTNVEMTLMYLYE